MGQSYDGLFKVFENPTPNEGEHDSDESGIHPVEDLARLSVPERKTRVESVAPAAKTAQMRFYLYGEIVRTTVPDAETRYKLDWGLIPYLNARLIAIIDAETIQEAAYRLGGIVPRPGPHAYRGIQSHAYLFERESVSSDFLPRADFRGRSLPYRVAKPDVGARYYLGTRGNFTSPRRTV